MQGGVRRPMLCLSRAVGIDHRPSGQPETQHALRCGTLFQPLARQCSTAGYRSLEDRAHFLVALACRPQRRIPGGHCGHSRSAVRRTSCTTHGGSPSEPARPARRPAAERVDRLLAKEPSFADIAQAGGDVITRDAPHPICGGFFFGSGQIDRVTEYETGLAGHYTFRGENGAPDPLIMDERFVAAYV